MGNQCCALTNNNNYTNNKDDDDDLLLKGVSVYYIQKFLLQEVIDAGLDVDSAKIYQMEPHLKSNNSNDFGLIRKKGANRTCPRDGQLGTAYVDAIEQHVDYVGRANIMLSYSWGNDIKSTVVDSIVAKCKADGRDPKRTYVWICCLCNNQHRLGSMDVPFDEFRETFYGIITGIGRIWSLMSPWDDPQYVKRMWCLFEMYTATTEPGVEAEIIMSADQKKKMIESLKNNEKGMNDLVAALSHTKIENAKVSRKDDRKNILTLVEGTIGLNERNTHFFTEWITSILVSEAEKSDRNSDDMDHAKTLYGIGLAYHEMGDFEEAIEKYEECLTIRKRLQVEEHVDTATVYDKIGLVKYVKHDYEDAMEVLHKALTIRLKIFGEEHVDTAQNYNDIGSIKYSESDYDGALEMLQKALTIYVNVLGEEHKNTSKTLNIIGEVKQAKGDFDGALKLYQKALGIIVKVYGEEHVETLISFNNIGLLKYSEGDYNSALEMLQKALGISEKILGMDHPLTLQTSGNIKAVKYAMGD